MRPLAHHLPLTEEPRAGFFRYLVLRWHDWHVRSGADASLARQGAAGWIWYKVSGAMSDRYNGWFFLAPDYRAPAWFVGARDLPKQAPVGGLCAP